MLGILFDDILTSNYLQMAFILEVYRPFLSIDFKEKKSIGYKGLAPINYLRLFVNFVKKYNLTYLYYFT